MGGVWIDRRGASFVRVGECGFASEERERRETFSAVLFLFLILALSFTGLRLMVDTSHELLNPFDGYA